MKKAFAVTGLILGVVGVICGAAAVVFSSVSLGSGKKGI